MKSLLFGLILALTSLSSLANERQFVGDNVAVTLRESACPDNIQKLVDMFNPPKGLVWKRADVLFQGKPLEACYAEFQGQVLLVDEDGDGGAIPVGEFKPIKVL
jgi:hypothetical protein